MQLRTAGQLGTQWVSVGLVVAGLTLGCGSSDGSGLTDGGSSSGARGGSSGAGAQGGTGGTGAVGGSGGAGAVGGSGGAAGGTAGVGGTSGGAAGGGAGGVGAGGAGGVAGSGATGGSGGSVGPVTNAIACGGEVCNSAQNEYCCAIKGTDFSCKSSRNACSCGIACSDLVRLECDGREDCGNGQQCCYERYTAQAASTKCLDKCDSMIGVVSRSEVCRLDGGGACSSGTCQPHSELPPGYGTCK
ncbi:MAG: hypothetical protein KIT72_05990 [Polyangiaceae bacterium]|nr:hypothetical protein [Polyangiaceae bacterium]MCW5789951.1 hypothetical protein [Polyangiaceae bacterium]